MRKDYRLTINGITHTITNVTKAELARIGVALAPEGGEICVVPID